MNTNEIEKKIYNRKDLVIIKQDKPVACLIEKLHNVEAQANPEEEDERAQWLLFEAWRVGII